jgi:DNA-binding CsgD family transcriptional regulator
MKPEKPTPTGLTTPQLLARLSSAARRLVDIAAVLGLSFRLRDVTALLDTTATRLVGEVRELIDTGLISDDGEALIFADDRVRRAVLDALPPTLCRALHRDVALYLLSTGARAADVAPDVLAGSDADDPVADSAEQLETAPNMYRRALDFAAVGTRRWLSLVPLTARALAYAGDPAQAETLLHTALGLGLNAAAQAEARLVLAEVARLRGRRDDDTRVPGPALPGRLSGPARSRAAWQPPPRAQQARRPAFGWDSLTAAELPVVALVATGATNKEIAGRLWLSPHTVDTHVRHALEKLGLRSRVEMARQAGERGLRPAEHPAPRPAPDAAPPRPARSVRGRQGDRGVQVGAAAGRTIQPQAAAEGLDPVLESAKAAAAEVRAA